MSVQYILFPKECDMRIYQNILRVLIAAFTAQLLCGQTTGTMGGLVVIAAGKPVSGAIVVAGLVPSGGQDVMPLASSVKTGADGRFTIAGLPPGMYNICAQLPGSALVDSCQWRSPASTATVSIGKASAVPTITMETGHLVKARIDDPQGLLLAHEGKTRGAHLLVGVWSNNGLFVPIPVSNSDAGGRDHQVYVPNDADLQLSVFSAFFKVGDGIGAALAQTADSRPVQNFGFKVAATDGPKGFSFRVLGKN